ncbi:MAG: ornithine cyclodeaminase, partial [Alphaproteobacteria bacterium]|nr:ornithine cyclodeaminase [Alphaproteobacteria bacterium]
MPLYLDVTAVANLIRRKTLEAALRELAGYIEKDYARWNEFDKSPRAVVHSPLGVNELMPVGDSKLYSFKYVNGHPGNTAKGLMTVIAFGMLANVETGYPMLISDLTLMTAMRTAADAAVAAKYLARKNSKSMAVIGCGAQSEFQIAAFRALLGIAEFRVFDTDPAAMEKLVRNLSGVDGIKIIPAASVREAVRGADIVTTATADKTRAAIITPDMIEPGMHINGIGGDCPGKTEIHPDVVRNARVVVEYEKQARVEGDIQQMPIDFPVIELWEVITGAKPGRESDDQVTFFDSVGIALEDFSALRYLYDIATEANAGIKLDLLPNLPDPKDLYGLLQA